MSLDEFKLLLILVCVLCLSICFLGRNSILTLRAFLSFSAMGFLAQLALGQELNRYTPNITLYVSYVSIAVTIAWGTGFLLLWAVHSWLAEHYKKTAGLGIYCLCGIPMLVGLEIIGSNVIKMKLHNYQQYVALMPSLNTMHAPKWLYGYYIITGIIIFFVAKALGLYAMSRKECVCEKVPIIDNSPKQID
jgi:hypothetical protein